MDDRHPTTEYRPQVTFCAYDGRGQINGPNIWLTRIMSLLRQRNVDARVLFLLDAPPEQCPTFQALQAAGVPCRAIERQRSTGERVRWLLAELRAEPPDVFVPNVVVPAYYAARWLRAAGIPTVGVLHSDDAFHHALLERFVIGNQADRLSALVCVSQALEELARAVVQEEGKKLKRRANNKQQTNNKQPRTENQDNGQPTTQISRIPYGVAIPEQTAAMPSNSFRLIYVGRLNEEQKRISLLARALCRAARELPGVEAEIYGAGHARPAVEAILANESTRLPVRLAGELAPHAVQTTLRKAHAFVLLSAYEGLPIALMEAMACGLVPICTPMRSGIGELVRHGENGLMVADGGDGFVAAVRRLASEPGLWPRLSAAARATIAADYDDGSCADRWVALLSNLSVGRKRGMISVPRRLQLPPTHHAFRREDHRGPPFVAELIRRGRYVFGTLRLGLQAYTVKMLVTLLRRNAKE